MALLMAAGCGGASGTAAQLPACGRPPSPSAEQPPSGAVLPPTARMTALRRQPPLTQLNAYVELSPDAVHDWIVSDPDLDVLESSAAGHQQELLVTDGEHTTWMSARAVCDGASVLAEVTTRADSGADLPAVGGADDG